MARKEPLLDPPGPGWKRDLPGPNDLPERDVYLNVLDNPPNHMDDIYIEFPRSSLRGRGVLVWIGFLQIVGALFLLFICLTDGFSVWFYSFTFVMIFLVVMMAGSAIRVDISLPLDEPIRFNRIRKKVYIYRYHHEFGRPFSSASWGLRPKDYDWGDLRVEACGAYGPMGTGGSIQTVSIAVVEKGTNKVIDRFVLSHSHHQGGILWAMAQTFMLQGPQALPKMTRPPRDWNNEDPGWNIARRFAPKVQWPPEMDIESRTAP